MPLTYGVVPELYIKHKLNIIAIAQRDIKRGEPIVTCDLYTGKVSRCSSIKFLPHGKKKLEGKWRT